MIETSNKSKNITKGILIAVTCGLLSSLLNVGFANAAPVAQTAIEFGVIPRNSSLAAWVVVLGELFDEPDTCLFAIRNNFGILSVLINH